LADIPKIAGFPTGHISGLIHACHHRRSGSACFNQGGLESAHCRDQSARIIERYVCALCYCIKTSGYSGSRSGSSFFCPHKRHERVFGRIRRSKCFFTRSRSAQTTQPRRQSCATISAKTRHQAFAKVTSPQSFKAAYQQTRSHRVDQPTRQRSKRSANQGRQERLQEPGFDQSGFRIDRKRAAIGHSQLLQVADLIRRHVDEHLVIATSLVGEMLCG
jgi:hypothetical protein